MPVVGRAPRGRDTQGHAMNSASSFTRLGAAVAATTLLLGLSMDSRSASDVLAGPAGTGSPRATVAYGLSIFSGEP